MSVARELLALAETTDRRLSIPAVRAVLAPPRREHPPLQGEFGVVMLADGSAGFFYALLETPCAGCTRSSTGPAPRASRRSPSLRASRATTRSSAP